MVGAAFVGGGFMAEVHSRAARAARARLVAIASSSPKRAAEAGERLGIEHSAPSLDKLLENDGVDIVHICTPNALHAEQTLAVITAGKHVICEKPLATTVEDAENLTEAAIEARVVATVPFVYRFHPMVREARARFRMGEVGQLLTIHGEYLQDWLLEETDDNWRVDTNAGGASRAFADIGSHLVDLIEFITGDRIARVAAAKRTFFRDRAGNSEVATEDAVTVIIETHAGAIGSLLVSQVAAGRKNHLRIELSGSAESIGFDQENPDDLWIGRRRGNLTIPRDAGQLHPDAARLSIVPAGHPQGYQDAFNAFVADSYAAIAGELPDGLPLFADGLRAARITDAVMTASATARWVETT
ncbi:MAG TPA: Gfo/Idh/MocA family oxidoreductase [Galbitalea sp.]|jgi:predicted dehydrogenase|nr:Gfo/Idh/MocA family oxidoreductase [Galbitalea sp.]